MRIASPWVVDEDRYDFKHLALAWMVVGEGREVIHEMLSNRQAEL